MANLPQGQLVAGGWRESQEGCKRVRRVQGMVGQAAGRQQCLGDSHFHIPQAAIALGSKQKRPRMAVEVRMSSEKVVVGSFLFSHPSPPPMPQLLALSRRD